jgi:hypothetical protein
MNDYSDTIKNNPVLRRMYELASLRFGHDRIVVRRVVPREIVVNKRYAWQLFEFPSDADPVETVVLDVDFPRKLQIDDEVSIDLDRLRNSGSDTGERSAE